MNDKNDKSNLYKLNRDFYNRDTLLVAEELIGKILVYNNNGYILSGRISETEAYIGAVDKASHCYGGKITERNKTLFGPPGHTYVYMIYGMYYCMNVVTEQEGCGSGVLLRGMIPLENIDMMCLNRYNKHLNEISKTQLKNLSNGPGKLCKALNITKKENDIDLIKEEIYILNDGYKNYEIEHTKRINIDYAEEAKDFMWRFLMKQRS